MKWLVTLCCLLSIYTFSIAQNKIEDIKPLPIKVKIAGENMQKVYLMDIDKTSLTFFTNKKQFKQNVLTDCSACQTVALDNLDKLIVLGSKQHAGKIAGGMLALLITGIAAANPRGDGLDAAATAGIYGTFYGGGALALGTAIDFLVNNNQSKEVLNRHKTQLVNKKKMNIAMVTFFMDNSPLAQFERIQQQQQLALQEMIQEIKERPLMHQQRFSFFSKVHPVASGYLIGSDDTFIYLSDNLFRLVEDRAERPLNLKKVKLTDIFYYQID